VSIRDLNRPHKSIFLNEAEIKDALAVMEQDNLLNTAPCYVKDSLTSIHLVTFREKHMIYLKSHPKVNPQHYLSNLRTMIKIRV
jgi:hypothetical protein